jgi:hypothetical protein
METIAASVAAIETLIDKCDPGRRMIGHVNHFIDI